MQDYFGILYVCACVRACVHMCIYIYIYIIYIYIYIYAGNESPGSEFYFTLLTHICDIWNLCSLMCFLVITV